MICISADEDVEEVSRQVCSKATFKYVLPIHLRGIDRLAASEARARSRGASPSRRHQHHIHVHGPINASVNVGQPSKCLLQRLININITIIIEKLLTTMMVLINMYPNI